MHFDIEGGAEIEVSDGLRIDPEISRETASGRRQRAP